ncbi:DUF4375 domain-containing protein [Hymenobacter busanensis]|uniref:DUF4375 domain-containing protein n=1 Tax=Hymenobacter busanensis TaxID=2607656 RepID=A0A7L4ZTG8_9BACT|nr:DMP19 family protein [Hymenobacter busanensis]KAA9327576.1 DUF4375 domain-containing protein [Hymenobacter busanensis]QHJ06086.1 DUF4375 domain-containing protein [Hymenobacter busanensis]
MKLLSRLQELIGIKWVTLPAVSAAELEQAKANDWQYLYVFIQAYYRHVRPETPETRMDKFSNAACILILFNVLYGEVTNGGFIQLIQNGYGPHLFETPLAKDLAGWGASDLAELVNHAKRIYQAHREYLERQRTIPEFSALYQDFQEFVPLENRFYDIIDGQTAIVRAHVEQHIAQFAQIEE